MTKELLIFGAQGALGKGISEVLIKEDFSKIYLFDFNLENKKYDNSSVENVRIKDLSKEENVEEAFQSVSLSKDKTFFLYSTVGGYLGGKYIWETESDEWDKAFNMNLKSNFLIAKYFSKLVKESSGGSICFTAAFTGVNPETKKGAYGAAKGALIHLVKTLAVEGEEINLSVNAIAPYIIDTQANRKWMKEGNYEKWIKAEEIGALTSYLFKCYNFITGNVITLTNRFEIKSE